MVRNVNNTLLYWCMLVFMAGILAFPAQAHNGQDHQVTDKDAGVSAALHWLELSQDEQGIVINPADIATDFQATAEALTVFALLDSSIANRPAALSALKNSPQALTTEGLARLLIALSENAQPLTTQQVDLLSRQNRDGGFGEFEGYGSTALDTSLALLALQQVGADTLIAGKALAFLSANQLSNGGFAVYGDQSSAIVTAMVLGSIRGYLYTYNISDILSRAVEFLYASENTGGGWGSYWETALVLQALIPVTTDVARYQQALDYLRNGQSVNGDWSQQVYTTALAASALNMLISVDVPVDPEKAVVTGRIEDASTGLPISGVVIDALGITTETVDVQSDGTFIVSNLDPDVYVFAYSASGYLGVSQNITLQKGQFANIGTVRLSIAPTAALINGVITDVSSSSPIAGATVSAVVSGKATNTNTDASGTYQLLTEAGHVVIEVSAKDYRPVMVSTNLVAGTRVQFSPSLLLSSEEPPAASTVTGIVVDEQGQFVAGANVAIIEGPTTTTNTNGVFELSDLSPSEIQVIISKTGYETKSFSVVVPEKTNANVGKIALRDQQILPSSIVSGRVIDMVSGNGVPAASVVIAGLSTTTDTNGFYRIADIPVLEFTVSVNASGYLFANKQVALAEHTELSLDINIRQADLGGVEISGITTNQTSYSAFDTVVISATVENNTALSQGARLYVNVKNSSGKEVASFSGAFLPPLDPMSDLEELAHYQQHLEETIEKFTPGEQRTIVLEQWWNTLSVAPDTYTITVQALDSITSNLVSERSILVIVEPTRSITLDVKASPGYVLLDSSSDIELFAEVFNRSNTTASISFDYRLLDPSNQILTHGSSKFDLAVDQTNQKLELLSFPHNFVASGYYKIEVSNITGTDVSELSQGSVFVPPSIRLRATQSLDPNEVVPLEGVPVKSNIQIEGVDGE